MNSSEVLLNPLARVSLVIGLGLGATACMGAETSGNGLQDTVLEPGVTIEVPDEDGSIKRMHCTEFFEVGVDAGESPIEAIQNADNLFMHEDESGPIAPPESLEDSHYWTSILQQVNPENIFIPAKHTTLVYVPNLPCDPVE